MKRVTRYLAFLVLFIGMQVPAHAVDYPELYVFGDSLVDSGNAYLATSGAEAKTPDGYYLGRFSNGLNFADYISLAMTGLPTKPAFIGGLNVAVGGADVQYKPNQQSPSFLAQIEYYTAFISQPIASDALVLITFGGNDVRDTIGTGGPVDFTGAADDFYAGLQELYGLGARNFVITGAPDIGLLPISIAATGGDAVRLGELTERSEDISSLFSDKGSEFAALSGSQVSFFDLLDFEHQLLADPTVFGLSSTLNTTQPCQILGAGSPQIANCANSLYFDQIHPTTQIHAAIAQSILTQLTSPVPEPATWSLIIVGFGLAGVAMRKRPARLVRLAV